MPVDTGLAQLSNGFLVVALISYALALLGYAGDFAFGRRGGETMRTARMIVPALAGGDGSAAGSTAVVRLAPGSLAGDERGADRMGTRPSDGAVISDHERPRAQAGPWVRAALILTVTGAAAHVGGVITRGLAAHRLPWGDMYEYITALTCVAVVFFLAIMIRYQVWRLGLFVIGAVVASLGLAETVIYTPAGPLVPALQSYWLAIHVTAMTLAAGTFFVAAVLGVVYLAAARHASREAAGRAGRAGEILRWLPGPEALDRLAYRTVVFAYPLWTFGLIAGAIWGDQAWGRYWGWDPVETWAFITWVVYAAFLHARATAGWRGRRAAYIQLAGFCCLLFNVIGVQVFITGLHSYAGLN